MSTTKVVPCQRCELPLRVNPKPSSKATMLKRAKDGKGLCVHCAAHDWLRNTYPINIQLAESGPRALLMPHIQEMYAEIMRSQLADAKPDEISWNRIVEFWELPFPHKIKPTGRNPVSQKELDEITSGKRPGLGGRINEARESLSMDSDLTIRSFEELNELEAGLGDELRESLTKERKPDEQSGKKEPGDDEPPPTQLTFW